MLALLVKALPEDATDQNSGQRAAVQNGVANAARGGMETGAEAVSELRGG